MGQDPGSIREEIEDTRGRMGDTVDALTYKANVPERVKETFADKRDRLKHQMSGTASRMNEATPDADDVKGGAQQAVGFAQENPLGLAIGGLAAGFLVGMMIPSTRIEDERIGPVADEVKDQVSETAGEALDRGKQVAQDVAETARDSAEEAVATVKDDVKETAQESGQQQAEELRSS